MTPIIWLIHIMLAFLSLRLPPRSDKPKIPRGFEILSLAFLSKIFILQLSYVHSWEIVLSAKILVPFFSLMGKRALSH